VRGNVSIKNIPKSRKSVYYQIHQKIFKNNYTGLYSLVGARRVGKTTVLQQLCEEFNGYYFSVEQLKCGINDWGDCERYEKIFTDLLYSDEKLICIDEVTQLPYNVMGILSHHLKLIRNKIIIVTGSIPESVRDFCQIAGTQIEFRMHALTYYEYINWYDMKISMESYTRYLTFKQHEEIKDIKDYAIDVLRCSINSYHTYDVEHEEIVEWIKDAFSSEDKFKRYISLVCLTGQFKLTKSNHFEVLPNLQIRNEEQLKNYANLKRTILTKKEHINALAKFLQITGLGQTRILYGLQSVELRPDVYDFSTLENIREIQRFTTFEFPCFGSAVYETLVTEHPADLNNQCEVDIFNLASRMFNDVGKLRENDDIEIDFISENVLIEIKNSSQKHIAKHVRQYLDIATVVNCDQLIITTSDDVLKVFDKTVERTDNLSNGYSTIKVMLVNLPKFVYALGQAETDYKSEKISKDPIDYIYSIIENLDKSFIRLEDQTHNFGK
jgi:hypothetical protein